jgi:MFS family permease
VRVTADRTPSRTGVATSTAHGPHYKWVALSNTTLGLLMATINSSIVLIAMPDIFRGIGIDPLAPSNTGYLLWMLMGFMVVTAVLVVGLGRLGDMYGRVRIYNLGFLIFAVSSVLLAVTWMRGDAAAMWLIGWRIVQGIGGACLMANSSAILTDAFPTRQRGTALGINGVAAIAGSFLGLVIGGVLGPVNWHLVFLVSVPFGVFGTIWAYLKLRDTGERRPARMDWWGNLTFAVGLIAVLVGITYGIQPYGGHVMGWTSPFVLACIIGGGVVLALFVLIELRVANPLFDLSLFRIRPFTLGNTANLLASLGRGGLQFVLIIWLQGIWLPQHGYSFEETPLWAGIYMLPMTVGFLVAGPLSGVLSDRMGTRWFSTGGLLLTAVSFVLLELLPVDFDYRLFALLLLLNGIGMGLFSSPNRAEVMNSLPARARGAGAGMNATFQNSGMVLSIGLFFTLMIAGLAATLPAALSSGLTAHGVPAADAARIAALPPVAVLFAAFLGFNPVQQLLGPVLGTLPPDQAAYLTGRSFFPQLITDPFSDGLTAAFWFAIIACLVAAAASWFSGARRSTALRESVGAELAADAGELVRDDGSADLPGTVTTPIPAGRLSGTLRRPDGAEVGRGAVTVTTADGQEVGRVPVGPDGSYSLGGLRPGSYLVLATAPGFRGDAATVVLNGVGAAHDFALRGTATLTGVVTAATGGPLADALVVATDRDGRVVGRTRSGGDGSWSLTGLPVCETTVVASHRGHRPATASVVTGPVPGTADLTLVPAVTGLTGTVRGPDGAPLPGVTVTATDGNGDLAAIAVTDRAGAYALPGLEPGGYTVVATSHLPAVSRVELAAGPVTRVDLDLGAPSHERPRHAAPRER